MRPLILPFALCLWVLGNLPVARGQQPVTANDPYLVWAVQQWGSAVVADPTQEATVWGTNADPDRDGRTNLEEYAFGTNPNQPDTDPLVRDYGAANPGYLTLSYTQRANDPALVVFPQYSDDMQTWWPVPPRDAFSWQGDGTYFWNTTTGTVVNGMQTVSRVSTVPLANATGAFARVLVLRNGVQAIGSPLSAVQFFDGVSGQGGASVDSNSVVLSGFAGSVAVAVSGGAHLIVNGVDVGASTNVSAGSTVRIRAASPTTASSASYSISIGGVLTKTWTLTTRPAVSPALVVSPGVSSVPSGYTPVSTSVGQSGAANISIPITVPPGTGGMEPKLGISYSSQGGNGLLGIGFGLSGLSAVTRSGPVQYLDGIKGGVSFGANDRFTVDGQRLVLYSGTWGGDGSEYRTEQESFAKVNSQGTTTAGPLSWTMKTKAGLTYEYGTSADSRILANRSSVSGDTAVLMWALTRITDNVGNSIEFTYATPDGTESGNPRIAVIAYTKNTAAGLASNEQVLFTYAPRPDVRTSYVAGAKVVMDQRLTAIDCTNEGNAARHYDFAYQQANVSNNSQLVSVTEKGKRPTDGTAWQAFQPTTFTWDAKPVGTPKMSITTTATDPTLATLGFSKSPPSLIVQGDFNGDGRMDVMHFDDHGGSDIWIAYGNSNGTLTKVTATGFTTADADDYTHNTTYSRIVTGDFNGDGKTDVLQMSRSGSTNWVALSKGDGSFNVLHGAQLGALQNVGQTGDYQTDVFALDLNGDGRTDIVLLNKSGNNRVFLSKGDGSFSEVPIPANNPFKSFKIAPDSDGTNTYLVPGDFNGDGLGDILLLYADGNHQLALSNGDGTFTVRTGSQLGSIAGVGFRRTRAAFVSGDFNGDGLTDLAHFDNDTYPAWLALCKGDGTFDVITNPPSLQGLPLAVPSSSILEVGDFAGNGFSDIFCASYPYSGSDWLVSSRGDTSFFAQTAGNLGVLDGQVYDKFDDYRMRDRLFVGDFDGDGTDDVLYLYQEADVSYHTRSNGYNADRVTQVTNGHGGYTKITYQPLTNPWGYTKGTTSVYPYVDVISPMYVVGTLVSRNGIDGDAFTVQATPANGESTVFYHYFGATARLDGYGYQGFAAVNETSLDTGITSRTEYVTTDPNLAGHPSRQIQTLSEGRIITDTQTLWTSNPTTLPSGMQVHAPYTTYSVTYDYEINNGLTSSPIKTTIINGQTQDAFGNLTHSLTDYGGGFTEETTSTYTNDTTHWWLGRLSDTVVKQTSPGPVTATRHSTFQYSPTNGQLTRETIVTPESNLQLQKDYVHDAFGNIKQSTLTDLGTGITRTTQTAYTPDGRFIQQTTNAVGQVEGKTYDPFNGTVLSQTGPNGLTTIWSYDGFGRPLTETRPDGTQTFTWYRLCAPGSGVPPRAVHCVISQSSGSGPAAVYFDILDRQIRQDATGFNGSVVSTHAVFDAKGETINTSLPFFSTSSQPTAPPGQYTTNYYDAISRVYEQDVPGGVNENGPRKTTTTYAGLSATVTNPKSQTFQTAVDSRGRTAASTSFGTDTVTNTHDPYGNLIKVDDGHSHLTTMVYDGRGNKISMTEPNSGTTTYGYDAFGELTSQTDALKRTTTLSYDVLGRLVKRVEPDAPGIIGGTVAAGQPVETDWVYENAPNGQPNPNGVGKLGFVWRQSDGYLESYRYDRLGRLTETLTQVGAMQFVMGTTFDEYSRPDTLSYPTGFAVRNHYNAYGHLDYVYDAGPSGLKYWTASSVNARGQVAQEQFGNGLVTQRSYDPYTGLLGSIQTGRGSGTGFTASVQNLAYTFDQLNNLTQRQDLSSKVTEGFTYDATNQLSGTTCSAAAAVTITCDHLGNIQNRTDVGAYTYGEHSAGPHAVTSIAGVNGQPSHTLFYNAVGNCTQKDATTLEYSAANQPVAIRASAGTILFAYTPGRARLKRTELVAGALTNRVYIGSLYERDDGPNGIVHTHFIPAGGGVVAIYTQTQTTGGTASQTRYVHKDHLGSVQTLTDEQGNVAETLYYDAWGRRRTLALDQTTQSLRYSYGTVTSGTDRGFTGHEMLDAVGLIHMNGRIYDPTIGRFLSVDPLVQEAGNLQNLNRYCYVLNNPLSLTDPSGFLFSGLGHWLGKHWQTVVQIGIKALYFVPGAQGIAFGLDVAFAFGSAFTGTLLAGGSVGDAFRAGAIFGVGTALTAGNGAQGFGGFIGNAIANGVVQGGVASLEGGRFTHGFYSGAFASAIGSQVGGIQGFDGAGVLRAVASATVGGTASSIGGGKFANGAVTGAMSSALGGSSEEESSGTSSEARSAFDANDVTNVVGAIANLPIAIPMVLANQVGGFFTGFFKSNPSYFGIGSPDTLIFSDSVGLDPKNPSGYAGLLGASMSLAHWEGIWGDGLRFEQGQYYGHNLSTDSGSLTSRPLQSIGETFGQVSTVLKAAGVGEWGMSLNPFGGAFGRGWDSGLRMNRSTYETYGHNGLETGQIPPK